MLRAWSQSDAQAGVTLATQAYGAAIGQSARAAVDKLINNPAYLKQCARNLALDDTKALKSGLKKLESFAASIDG